MANSAIDAQQSYNYDPSHLDISISKCFKIKVQSFMKEIYSSARTAVHDASS